MKFAKILILLMMFTAMPMASALGTFHTYDEQTKTATIYDWAGLDKIANVQLISNTNYCITTCEAVIRITPDNDINANSNEDYNIKIKELDKIKDASHKVKSIQTFKKTGTQTSEVLRQTGVSCQTLNEANGTYQSCTPTYSYVNETKDVWTSFNLNPAFFNKLDGPVDVKIVGKKDKNASVDWIPTFYGVEISEMAVWTASMNVGLVRYYKFNNSLNNSVLGQMNLTNFEGTTKFTPGVIGNASNVTDGNNFMNGSSSSAASDVFNLPVNMTVNIWLKLGATTTDMAVLDKYQGGGVGWAWEYTNNGNIRCSQDCDSVGDALATGNGAVTTTQWSMITMIKNDTNTCFYVNATIVDCDVSSATRASTRPMHFGNNIITANDFNGMYDENGWWNRTLSASEISDLFNGGAGITYTTDFTPPSSVVVSHLSPVNFFNTSLTSINFSANATTNNLNLTNMTLYIDGVADLINTTVSTNNSDAQTATAFFQKTGLTEGMHNWSVYACGRNETGSLCAWTSGNRTFTVDQTVPVINIAFPANGLHFVTYNSQINVSFNWTTTDNFGLGSCWYYNGTGNTTITCGNNATIPLGDGWNTLTAYANDSVNNVGLNSTTFFINWIRPNVTFPASVVEGENSTIVYTLTATNITSIDVNITYVSSNYTTITNVSNNTYYSAYRVVTAPLVSSNTNVNVTSHFALDGTRYNTSLQTQLVYNLPVLNVSATCTDRAITFNLVDEQTLLGLNGTYQYNFKYGLAGNSTLVESYGTLNGLSQFSLCINSSISTNFTLGEGMIFYTNATGSGYADRRYYLFDGLTLTNQTVTNVTLYDLLNSEQTSFQLVVQDTSLTPYVNKFTTLVRWYPALNQYNIVDMGLTDETGATVIHVEAEDVDYRIGVYERNGTLINLADPIRMVCIASPCTYTLSISPGAIDYSAFLEVQYTFTFNETTNIWSFVYSDPTMTTSTMNLTVFKDTGTSTIVVCNSAVTGASGAITCNTTGYTGTLRGEVKRSASPPVLIVQKIINNAYNAFRSPWGLWIGLMIAIPATMVLAYVSPMAALFGAVIALVPAYYLSSVSWTVIAGFAMMAGIIAHFIRRV